MAACDRTENIRRHHWEDDQMQRIHITLSDDDISAVERADLACKIEVILRISRFRWQVSLPGTEFSVG